VILPLSAKPAFVSTRADAEFHRRTVDHSRVRPVARAASTTAHAASVAMPAPCTDRSSSNASSGSSTEALPTTRPQ
jgi:hypothetical protein